MIVLNGHIPGIALTICSFGDDNLKESLGILLWGYPKLIEFAFNPELTEVRRKRIEEQR